MGSGVSKSVNLGRRTGNCCKQWTEVIFPVITAIISKDKMYIFGGTSNSEEFSRTEILDLKSFSWTDLDSQNGVPPALDSHTANLYESPAGPRMIVFGGFSKGERTNSVYSLDLSSLNWSKVPTSPRCPEIRLSHSSVVYGGSLYVFGGISDEGEKLNDFWRLDLSTSVWEEVLGEGDIPTGRSGHTAVVYKDLMVMFGGMKDITKETNDMYSYSFSTNLWTLFQYEHQVKDPVSPDQLEEFKKSKATLAAMKAKNAGAEPSPPRMSPVRRPTIFDSSRASPSRRPTIDLEHSGGYRRRRTLYEGPLNPTEGRIRGRLPHPRDGHSAVVNEDIMVIFGGDRHQMPFNDTYVYYLVEENIKTPVSALIAN